MSYRIIIAKDFSDTPGARYESEGPNSGELFRDKILIPKFKEAVEKDKILFIDLDGCYGYATSFLEESFGGLVRKLQFKGALKHIQIKSDDDDTLEGLIKRYVEEAEKKL